MGALDSLWKRNLTALEPYWEQVFGILGDTTVVLPLVGLGDDGLPDAATFTTRRRTATGLEAVFTWSEAPSGFDSPFDPTNPTSWQGLVPVVRFNGADEEADSPDATYWSRDDAGGANGLSVSAWVMMAAGGGAQRILSKDDVTDREWFFRIDSADTVKLLLVDDSAGVNCSRSSAGTLTPGIWHHIVATYDGAGGASAANTINLYIDGVASNGAASNDGSYVGMEDLGAVVALGFTPDATPTDFFNGSMGGGPFGPFFTQKELTAAEVKRLYNLGRAALGLT